MFLLPSQTWSTLKEKTALQRANSFFYELTPFAKTYSFRKGNKKSWKLFPVCKNGGKTWRCTHIFQIKVDVLRNKYITQHNQTNNKVRQFGYVDFMVKSESENGLSAFT